jgi:hypothetical protein
LILNMKSGTRPITSRASSTPVFVRESDLRIEIENLEKRRSRAGIRAVGGGDIAGVLQR